MSKIFRNFPPLILCLICFLDPVFANNVSLAEQWGGENYAQNGLLQFKWAKNFFLDRYEWSGHEQVLDIGCGDGRLTYLISNYVPFGKVLGIDYSSSMIDYTHQKYDDCKNLSFQVEHAANENFYEQFESKFDVIVSFHCLHWVAL